MTIMNFYLHHLMQVILMIKLECFSSGSVGNFYLITTTNTNIVLECGVHCDYINQVFNKKNLFYKDINACITSHSHTDHSLSIKHFENYNIDCYCTYETYIKYKLNNYNQLYDNKIYKINDIQFLSFNVNHGDCECFGFIFKDKDSLILFITDFMECRKKLSKFAFNEIYIECNYIEDLWSNNVQDLENENNDDENKNRKYHRQINTHMNLDNLVTHLKKMNLSKCDKITLIHISKELGNIDKMKNRIIEEFGVECFAFLPNGKEI